MKNIFSNNFGVNKRKTKTHSNIDNVKRLIKTRVLLKQIDRKNGNPL